MKRMEEAAERFEKVGLEMLGGRSGRDGGTG